MSDSDGQILYSKRKDWADIVPIPQHENITPVAPIFYTDECESTTQVDKGRLSNLRLQTEMQLLTFAQSSKQTNTLNAFLI
jgi:protein farnesyltransferase/geranylgeranyltransferase type-1 subunit alpha